MYWEDLGLKMTLTGPVPITNSVTEFSFRLFWDLPNGSRPRCDWIVRFPLGLAASRNLWNPADSSMKVVIIAGLPTLCAVFWTLGS